AVENGLMAAGLLAVGVGFTGRFGVIGVPVLLLVLGFCAWMFRIVWAQTWYADAVARYHAGEPEHCLQALTRASPAGFRRRTADDIAVLLARARLQVGDLEGARTSLQKTRDSTACNSDILEAMLDAGRDIPPPEELLVETSRRPSRIFELTVLRAVWALQLGDPDTALSQVHRWENTRDWLPWVYRTRLDLLAAAAHQQRGENEAARGAMVRSGVRLSDRVWMRRVFPKWWRMMEAIEEDAGWRDWDQPSRY
ncbi:MAG: ATP/maltotriose-dependent transcriptional regulator MalT, partial [Kiritimatiellia bacterium]